MADKKQQDKQERLILLFKKVFSGPEGEEVLRSLFAEYYVIDGTFSEDSNKMYFREGQRSVVMRIMELIDIDLIKFREIMQKTQDEYSMEDF